MPAREATAGTSLAPRISFLALARRSDPPPRPRVRGPEIIIASEAKGLWMFPRPGPTCGTPLVLDVSGAVARVGAGRVARLADDPGGRQARRATILRDTPKLAAEAEGVCIMRRTLQAALLTGALAIGFGLGAGPSSAKADDDCDRDGGYGFAGYGGYGGRGYGGYGYGDRGYGRGRGYGHGHGPNTATTTGGMTARVAGRSRPVALAYRGARPYPISPYGYGGGAVQYSESRYDYRGYSTPFLGQPW